MSIEVTSVNMDFIGRVVILLGEDMEKFLNFFFTGTYVYTSDSLHIGYGVGSLRGASESSIRQLGVMTH